MRVWLIMVPFGKGWAHFGKPDCIQAYRTQADAKEDLRSARSQYVGAKLVSFVAAES